MAKTRGPPRAHHTFSSRSPPSPLYSSGAVQPQSSMSIAQPPAGPVHGEREALSLTPTSTSASTSTWASSTSMRGSKSGQGVATHSRTTPTPTPTLTPATSRSPSIMPDPEPSHRNSTHTDQPMYPLSLKSEDEAAQQNLEPLPHPQTPAQPPKRDPDLKPEPEALILPPQDTKPKKPLPPPTPTSKKTPPAGAQLIGHLPRAEKEAKDTFVEMEANHYQYGTLGRSREVLESMTCDCTYEHGVDERGRACGTDSDCINRLTQVECLEDDCRCRSYCQNQRFQRKQYADIEIVQTEKKGFGLRAGKDIRKDAFIYEYVGDVISQPSFLKRMRDYAAEDIRHFYFMMLQKDEFIDATKRGGIGRFANHSCSPNCYVAKWTIGKHVRMGIFASRHIKKDEELTFNYNVDRYGHEAQPCYCGEPNCVGFIGGKTQTDIAAMDDLYLDALGITDEVEKLALKGTKKKKGKKLDEDYMPILKPLVEKDVPKVVQAVRQTSSRKVLYKLLTRIKITEDQSALRQVMRLRGFSLMTNILHDYMQDMELLALALECMTSWPLLQRNKVDDSQVTVPVKVCAESENEVVKSSAQKLLAHWDTLESAYRIPKRMKTHANDEQEKVVVIYNNDDSSRPSKRTKFEDLLENPALKLAPVNYTQLAPPKIPVLSADENIGQGVPFETLESKRLAVAEIIAKAAASAAAAAEANKPPATPDPPEKPKRERPPRKQQSAEEKEANKEKRLQKLVGTVVVKCMSKHQKEMDHDLFKKHAKDLTQLIVDKEKKSSTYKDGKLESLSDEKVVKIKKFAKDYIAKILRKLNKSSQKRRLSSATHLTSTTSTDTPNSADGAEVTMADLGMNGGADDGDSDVDQEMGDDRGDERDGLQPPPADEDMDIPSVEASPVDDSSPQDMQMLPLLSPSIAQHQQSSDPRLRPPNGMVWEQTERHVLMGEPTSLFVGS